MIIEARKLCKKYPNFELRDVDISLPEGYVLGLIGPNGAGKTTTIKLLMDIIGPDAGEIEIFGMHWNEENEETIKQRIGYVGEEQPFYDDMSVKWTSNFVKQFYPNWDEEFYSDLINRFEIDEAKRVGDLSKGNRVRFALALALAHRPHLLILDEPTSGLDPIIRHEILKILAETISDGRRSILFSTHITEDLDKIADYIVLLNDGQVLLSDEKDTIASQTKKVCMRKDEFERLPLDLFIAHNIISNECVAVTTSFDEFWQVYENITGNEPRAFGMTLDEVMLAYAKGEV